MPMAKNQSAFIPLLLLFQIEAASLGFDSVLGGWGTTDAISFAATIFLEEQSSPLPHSVAAPCKPKAQGFGFALLRLEIKLALLPHLFMPMAKNQSALIPLFLLFRIKAALLGFDSVLPVGNEALWPPGGVGPEDLHERNKNPQSVRTGDFWCR